MWTPTRTSARLALALILSPCAPQYLPAQNTTDEWAAQLRSLNSTVFSATERPAAVDTIRRQVRTRRDEIHRSDRRAWAAVKTKADWEHFAAPRIEALRRSLGDFPPAPADLHPQVTRTIDGDGYRIENVVFESRPGVFVSANIYWPAPRRERMPAVVIIHSHHNPKTQGELQDMGMIWARQGCVVLVLDQLGYGERRQHQPGSRQDYRFRYIQGIQLHLIGDSLMGWMVWDVRGGLDLLLARPGIDKDKVILIGSVAGGGDPAAVAAALDSRVTCAVPFNFGGPQPETRFPLSDDAEETFNYMGGGSWESTRNLRLSGRDGFLPWVIVGSVAPRHLIYGHEFSWDRERDPVWKRLQTIFGFYEAANRLSFAHGRGLLSGRPPEASHCNNVGEVQRQWIHPALERWFGIPVPSERQTRLPSETLASFTPELLQKLKPRPMNEIYSDIAATRAAATRARLAALPPSQRRAQLRAEWTRLLGDVAPRTQPVVQANRDEALGQIRIERIRLEVEPGIVVPVLLLLPANPANTPRPCVIGLAQQGKDMFLRERSEALAELLAAGVAVCLPDVRGAGETALGKSRGPQSEATDYSSALLMLGQTYLGATLCDLRSVIQYLATRGDLNRNKMALWGDSSTPVNPANFKDPLIGEGEPPRPSEPLGGLLALLGGLFEEPIVAVAARQTIAGYQSVLRDLYCYVPHDVVVPGALTTGDLCDIAAVLAPRPLRIEALVDGRNCALDEQDAIRYFGPTVEAYHSASGQFSLKSKIADGLGQWLANALK